MAHLQQKNFCEKVKRSLPQYFSGVNVLDVGSLDINGNNRYLFSDYNYTGIDIAPGRNVDAVSKGHEWNAPDESYDVIISSECFEHDMYYPQTLSNIVRMLKPSGLFLFTCATTGRPEHGTRRTSQQDSPFTASLDDWCDYYKNLTEKDIREVLDIEKIFSSHYFEIEPFICDLYFFGIKK